MRRVRGGPGSCRLPPSKKNVGRASKDPPRAGADSKVFSPSWLHCVVHLYGSCPYRHVKELDSKGIDTNSWAVVRQAVNLSKIKKFEESRAPES